MKDVTKQENENGSFRKKVVSLAVCGMLAGVGFGALSAYRGGSTVMAAEEGEKKAEDKHVCATKNSCKSKGGCKSGDNGCAGKNSCKGKGGCATTDKHECATKNGCKGQGGCKTGDNKCAGANSCKGKGGCAVPVKKEEKKSEEKSK